MDDRTKMIRLIQSAVDGCATYWAGLIADKLMSHGLSFTGRTPIENLDMSLRTYNTLKRNGIDTVEELREWDEDALKRLRGVGERVFSEVQVIRNGGDGDG